MDRVVIENIRPWDGEYPLALDEQPLTTLEWRWVKRISGYLPLTIDEGFAGGDPDVVCALAAVALRRAGRIDKDEVLAVADRLADAPFDGSAIRLVATELDGPPPVAATAPPTSNGGESGNPTSAPSGSLESYWSPRLAEVCHLRPCDITDLTPAQLFAAFQYAHPDDE